MPIKLTFRPVQSDHSRANASAGTANTPLNVYVAEGVKAQLNEMSVSMKRSVSSIAAELIEAALEQLVIVEPDAPPQRTVRAEIIQRGRTLTPDEARAEASDNEAIRRGQNPRHSGDTAEATLASIRKEQRAAGVPDAFAVITPKPTREDIEFKRYNVATKQWHPDYDPVTHKWKR